MCMENFLSLCLWPSDVVSRKWYHEVAQCWSHGEDESSWKVFLETTEEEENNQGLENLACGKFCYAWCFFKKEETSFFEEGSWNF